MTGAVFTLLVLEAGDYRFVIKRLDLKDVDLAGRVLIRGVIKLHLGETYDMFGSSARARE